MHWYTSLLYYEHLLQFDSLSPGLNRQLMTFLGASVFFCICSSKRRRKAISPARLPRGGLTHHDGTRGGSRRGFPPGENPPNGPVRSGPGLCAYFSSCVHVAYGPFLYGFCGYIWTGSGVSTMTDALAECNFSNPMVRHCQKPPC